MGLKNWWKNRQYWQKGAIIGVVIGLISVLGFYLSVFSNNLFLISLFGYITLPTTYLLMNLYIFYITKGTMKVEGNIELGFVLPMLFSQLLSPLVYALTGALIGFIISKIKEKRR